MGKPLREDDHEDDDEWQMMGSNQVYPICFLFLRVTRKICLTCVSPETDDDEYTYLSIISVCHICLLLRVRNCSDF